MRRITTFLLLAAFAATHELFLHPAYFEETTLTLTAHDINRNLCKYGIGGSYYDLVPLINKDYDYNVSLASEGISYTVLFNFCQTIREPSCGLDSTLAGMVYTGEDGNRTCYNLSSGPGPRTNVDLIQSERDYLTKEEQAVESDDRKYGGMDLVYYQSEKCDNKRPNSLRIKLFCDKEQGTPKVFFSMVNANCEVEVSMIHQSACYEFSVNPLFRYIGSNKYLFGAILTVLGLTLGFFGKKLFKTAICLTSSLAITFALSLMVFTIFFSRNSSQTSEWIVFGVCGAIGVCLGLMFAMFFKIGIFIVGGWGGFCLGMILYNAAIYKLDTSANIAFWCTCITLAVICGLIALKLFNHALILGTSVGGAYSFVRGMSMFIGGFPDEMELFYLIKNGELESVSPWFYAYFAVFVILSILFAIFQYKMYFHLHQKSYNSGSHPYHSSKGRYR